MVQSGQYLHDWEWVVTNDIRALGCNLDAILRFGTRFWVPNDRDLRRELLEEAHCSKFVIHPRGTKMYRDLSSEVLVKAIMFS